MNAIDAKLLARLGAAVRRQTSALRTAYEAPNRDVDDQHVTIAGMLRPMLAEKPSKTELPTVLALSDMLGYGISVWGPFKQTDKLHPPQGGRVFAAIVSTSPIEGFQKMSLAQFVGAPIGTVPNGTKWGKWYTPRDLINWVANKEGATHFQPKAEAQLEALKSTMQVTGTAQLLGPDGVIIDFGSNTDFYVRSQVLQIALVTLQVTDGLLASVP